MDLLGIGSVLDFGSKVIEKLWPDPVEQDKAKLELLRLQQAGEFHEMDLAFAAAQAQIAVNMEEAKSTSVLVSGWRPMVGWVCVMALMYAAIIEPIARFVATVFFHYTGAFPVIDTDLTNQLLIGLLGLGGMRTYEKVKNVAAK